MFNASSRLRSALGLGLLATASLTSMPASAQIQRSFINLSFEQPALSAANCVTILSADFVPGSDTDHPANTILSTCTAVPAGSQANGTTGVPRLIELWRGNIEGPAPLARSGDQHAELNAYVSSRLSQTICLSKNEVVSWRMSHRGRISATVPDVMKFDIDGASNPIATMSTTKTGGGAAPDCPTSIAGSSVSNISCTSTSGGNGWRDYSGSFVWTGSSANHTVGFGAISSANSETTSVLNSSGGNFLDDIQFVLAPYVEFTTAGVSTREGASPATLPQIRVIGTVPAGGMTVLVNVTGGTAALGDDYLTSSGTVAVNVVVPEGTYDGTTAASLFALPIASFTNDVVIENNETVTFQILPTPTSYTLASTASCGGTPQDTHTLTLVDNDVDTTVTKSLTTTTPPAAGGTANYSVAFNNNTAKPTVGDLTAHDVIAAVNDAVPAGLTFTSWTCTGSGGGVCPAASGSGAITGNATLPAGNSGAAGGSVTYDITATLGATQCAVVTNSASISANDPVSEGTSVQAGFTTPAPNMPNTATADIDPNCADLNITKTDSTANYTPGGSSSYVLHACNAGPDATLGASINDTLPNGATLNAPWTCVGTAGGVCAASGGTIGSTSVSLTGVNLPVSACVDVTVPVSFSANPSSY